jgi:hypothetical protein
MLKNFHDDWLTGHMKARRYRQRIPVLSSSTAMFHTGHFQGLETDDTEVQDEEIVAMAVGLVVVCLKF